MKRQRLRSARAARASPLILPSSWKGASPRANPFRSRPKPSRSVAAARRSITDAAVESGIVVRLTPPFGRTIDAEVNGVWTDETDGKQRIGVKLLDANGWFAE